MVIGQKDEGRNGMELVKGINNGCRFLLEIAAIAAVGSWGFRLHLLGLWRFAVGGGAPLLLVLVWAVWGAPMAPFRLEGLYRLGLEILLFSVAAAALYASGNKGMAAMLAVAAVVNTLLLYILG